MFPVVYQDKRGWDVTDLSKTYIALMGGFLLGGTSRSMSAFHHWSYSKRSLIRRFHWGPSRVGTAKVQTSGGQA